MPRDKRLYMTFPIDFHRHPKLQRLPVEVRWTFVEMVGEARIADNDGVFTIEDAEFQWPTDHLAALVSSHPTRPLVRRTDEHYLLREYAEHQQTRAEREALSAKRAEAGRKGGKTRPNAKHLLSNGEQTEAESESESEDYYSPSKSQSLDTRASVSTDSFAISEMTQRQAAQKGVDLLGIARTLGGLGLQVDAFGAMALANHLLEKAKAFPSAPQRYVLACIRDSPHEVARYLHDAGLAA